MNEIASRKGQKHLFRFRGLLVLALWQAAPIGTDERGRTRIGFGIGGGQLEYAMLGCDGAVLESEKIGYLTAAGEVEHWLADNARVHASGGYQWADSLSARGPFGTIMLSYEGQNFGIGGGIGFVPRVEYEIGSPKKTVPSGMLRIGARDGWQWRMEVFPPSSRSYTEFVRSVAAFNQLSMTKTSGSIGVGMVGVLDAEPTLALVGNVFHPVSRNTLVGLSGYGSPGHDHAQLGVTVEIKIGLR